MGLISELHDIRAEMTYKERQRLERENKKTLQENYKKEINGDLQQLFYNLFKSLPYKEAYKKAIFEKDKNIDKITTYIEKLTYKKNGKTFYLYKNQFDVVQDLQDNYHKILNKIKKEFETIEKEKEKELQEKLLKEFKNYYKQHAEKWAVFETLQQNFIINYIIKDIAENEEEAETLQNIYFETLQKATKFYKMEITQQKQALKQAQRNAREQAKVKRRDRLAFLYLINKILK